MTHEPLSLGAESPAEGRRGGGRIQLAHGGGGLLTDELIARQILPRFRNEILGQLWDSALLPAAGADRIAFTIDSFVVSPWSFPGGDIGRLAVAGTVNDLAVCGARTIALALSLILAEGLPEKCLAAVLDSIAATAAEAGVQVVTGDTKVVGRSQADGIYITTAGLGLSPPDRTLDPARVRPGDVLLINGPIADHGLAVMLARELPEMQTGLRSDVRPLNRLCARLIEALGSDIAFMRDPTRGGLAGVAGDLAARTGWHVTLEETAIPTRPEANHAADMLGLDPLEIANEGKVVVVVRPERAAEALDLMAAAEPVGEARREGGRDSAGADEAPPVGPACIGRIESARDGICELRTAIGGRRVVHKPYGEQLPRIC